MSFFLTSFFPFIDAENKQSTTWSFWGLQKEEVEEQKARRKRDETLLTLLIEPKLLTASVCMKHSIHFYDL